MPRIPAVRDWWTDLRQDVRYGVRLLVHAPLFSLLAIVTLALGIGANAAAFGVLKSVLLDALPYADADRLVRVYGRMIDGTQERGPLSAAAVDDVATRTRSLAGIAAFSGPSDAVFGADDGSHLTKVMWVEPHLFETLGVSPARGRTFRPEDATNGLAPLSAGMLTPDTASAVMLTHGAWQRLFGSDSGIVGRTVRINGTPRTVIGVLPRTFVGPLGDADFYLAFDLRPAIADPNSARRSHWLGAVGRLTPGVTQAVAQRELADIGEAIAREYPKDSGAFRIAAMSLHDAMIGDTRRPLLMLMASAALVLLIACANLAGALLSRTLTRRKEFAVRLALGASRKRLVRQVLTESLLLAIAGGATGVLLARIVLSALQTFAVPARLLPDYADLSLDTGTILVTAAIALCTGLLFGITPALSVDQVDPQGTLRDEMRHAGESRRSHRLRGLLVAGQMALCVSLLVGAGLLSRSLWRMTTAPLGFDADGVLAATIPMPPREYKDTPARVRFIQEFTERLRALPGVTDVADATGIPTAVFSRMGLSIDGTSSPNDAQPFALFAMVSDNYFQTMRIPLLEGRTFDEQDGFDAAQSVIISEAMARRYWPRGGALHARVRIGPNPKAPLREVVGIVGDVRNDRARPDAEPILYRPSRQTYWPTVTFLLRTTSDPLGLMRPVEHELSAFAPQLAVQKMQTMRDVVGQGMASRRFPVFLVATFGGLALLLASIGIYAMFASAVAAREREFGVRMALGSRPGAIATLMLRQGAGWMAAGLAAGAFGIIIVVQLLRDLLFEVAPFDPIALGAALIILIVCATMALLIPIRRAMRVDPARALRAQ